MRKLALPKKLISSLVILLFCISVTNAQDVKYSALLLSFKGSGKLIRGDEEMDLELPQSFISGDKVVLTDGSAKLLLFSGDEVSIVATNTYDIPSVESASSTITSLASSEAKGSGLLGQSGMAYRMRGENNVFPVKSKIINTDNAIIRFQFDEPLTKPLSFKLVDSETQKTVWARENITDSTLSLSKITFEQGKSYYWTLSGMPTGKPVMGVISSSTNKDVKDIEANKDKKTHLDYIESILIFHRYNYYFEAHELLQEAIAKFPDAEVYKKMRENLLMNF